MQKFNQTSLLSQQEQAFDDLALNRYFIQTFTTSQFYYKKWSNADKKSKYNKYSEPAKSKKLMQVCLKEKCIVLERLRVIAGDIWGKFLPLGYKIMVFVMSHYFNVGKRNNVCELCDFECVCVWLKNKFAVSRKTHETKTQ